MIKFREFRGKQKDGNGWAYGSLIFTDSFCCILEAEEVVGGVNYPYLNQEFGTIDGTVTPVIPETVGQFTGMYDINRKKIFDGDIVKAMMNFGPGGWMECVVTIEYKTHDGYRWQYFDLETIEVIGNIYDNPELLERE